MTNCNMQANSYTDTIYLGIIMSKDCSFDSHIFSLSRKCKNLAGWILRSFVTRDKLAIDGNASKLTKFTMCRKHKKLFQNKLATECFLLLPYHREWYQK